MAKLIALDALNEVLRNIGEETVAGLTSLSTLQQLCFNKLNEAIDEICTDENTRWQFLESLGAVYMTTGNYKYTISGLTGTSTGSDMMREDRESFRQYDSGYNIKYITPQEFDDLYPKGITTANEGYPDRYTKYGGYLVFNKMAGTTQNTKLIDFRYWKQPLKYETATYTGTVDFPEPFDKTLIIALATMKALIYLGNDEAAVYKQYVYGDGRYVQGSLDKCKDIYASPDLKAKMTYIF